MLKLFLHILASGMYLLSPEGPQPIERQYPSWSSTYEWRFSGPTAQVQTNSSPEFLFVYDEKMKGVLVMGNVFTCKFTSDPKNVMLIRLDPRTNNRVLKAIPDTLHSIYPIIADSLAPLQYKVRIDHPLRSGEYAFAFYMPAFLGLKYVLTECLWPFSVYAPEMDTIPEFEPEIEIEHELEPQPEPVPEPGTRPILRATR